MGAKKDKKTQDKAYGFCYRRDLSAHQRVLALTQLSLKWQTLYDETTESNEIFLQAIQKQAQTSQQFPRFPTHKNYRASPARPAC
jgi:hypothetical protein